MEALIGQGGMAAVYRARHITLDSLHAVKILFITAPSVRQRLIREGRVQANLRHPNIVAVTDVLEVMGSPALVMEYVDGPPLDQWLLENKPTLEEALFLFRGILRGIMAAHERGVIHRDLKPANVMLSPTNEGVVPKVTDFGLVKSLEDQSGKTQTGMAMGTPEYMAPEQIRDASDVDQRVDMFALGCILYELVCHRRAFAGPDNVSIFNAIVSGTYPPPRKFVDDLPRNILEAIRTCLEPDREKRLATCVELFDLLYEDKTVGRLGALKASLAPIKISGTLPELPQTREPPPPPPAPPVEPVTPPPQRRHLDPQTEMDSVITTGPTGGRARLVVPLVGTLLGGILVGAAVFAFLSGNPSAPPPQVLVLPEPTISVEPPPTPVTVKPAPAEPEPAEDEAADDGAGEDEDVQQVAAVQPAPVRPPAPAPRASPRPSPAPAPAAPQGGTIEVTGDARAVWLAAGEERIPASGVVPPGTYRILADFGQPELAAAGTVRVRAGQKLVLDCQSFLFQCRPK